MEKGLKISLFLLVLVLLAGLTKFGVIPNWLNIDFLNSDTNYTLKILSDKSNNLDNIGENVGEEILENVGEEIGENTGENDVIVDETSIGNDFYIEDGFYIIDEDNSNYPQGCNTPGLSHPEKCILHTLNDYYIAPDETEVIQTRYDANTYCNSLDILGLSWELPYAHQTEKSIYWMNIIDLKQKLYGLDANGSEKAGHYRAYPENPTFENCTLNGNCGNEFGSMKLSVRCIGYSGDMPHNIININSNNSVNGSNQSEYNRDYKEMNFYENEEFADLKPIIYIYPIKKTRVKLGLGRPENLSHTYPKYNSEKGWNVIAQPDGDLVDIDTNRKLYALYREGINSIGTNFDEGFVVAGKDIIPFLEEKLAILGLNEREAEEFIIYWLPQMEDNNWNLIRFETIEEQNENMPLNISPTPDTLIRIMMDWMAIDEPINIPEQKLVSPQRTGFTIVEWGGSPRN